MDKKALSESDICDRFITPAIEKAGWTSDQWRREFSFTDGKMIVRGKMVARGKPRRADYLLFYKPNIPIAVIEVKDNKHSVRAGMQQGLDCSERLEVPFVFSSNGDGFVMHDKTGTSPATEMNLTLDEFPTRAEMWRRYKLWRGIEDDTESLVTSPNHSEIGGKTPRYYQQLAINRTVEGVAHSAPSCCARSRRDRHRSRPPIGQGRSLRRYLNARKCLRGVGTSPAHRPIRLSLERLEPGGSAAGASDHHVGDGGCVQPGEDRCGYGCDGERSELIEVEAPRSTLGRCLGRGVLVWHGGAPCSAGAQPLPAV
jgi:hypothetical protein